MELATLPYVEYVRQLALAALSDEDFRDAVSCFMQGLTWKERVDLDCALVEVIAAPEYRLFWLRAVERKEFTDQIRQHFLSQS